MKAILCIWLSLAFSVVCTSSSAQTKDRYVEQNVGQTASASSEKNKRPTFVIMDNLNEKDALAKESVEKNFSKLFSPSDSRNLEKVYVVNYEKKYT